ncbi:hypothetical protein [Streptomyces sp. NPDC046805]|uniref:hypothetical protein n=1 Tax=Streptomyces sp. NPDC046805 TaxID=3155134 RepID=UPI0033DF1FFB
MTQPAAFLPGRPVVLRRGTVLPMDRARRVLTDTDVLVVDDRIAAVGLVASAVPLTARARVLRERRSTSG